MVDPALLEQAVRLSGSRTYSEAVARGLEALVLRSKARGILSLAGSGLWEGDLGEMRRDRPRRRGRRNGRG